MYKQFQLYFYIFKQLQLRLCSLIIYFHICKVYKYVVMHLNGVFDQMYCYLEIQLYIYSCTGICRYTKAGLHLCSFTSSVTCLVTQLCVYTDVQLYSFIGM